MPAVPRIRDSKRRSDARERGRFEICEVVSTVHGDRVARVFATATTAGDARLAAQTIRQECGIEPGRVRIHDRLRRCWLGAHRFEQKEEP